MHAAPPPVPRPMVWRVSGPVLAACGCIAGAAVLAVRDPSDGGGYVPCPFRTVTGLSCPGCGLTRACARLVHGDVRAALGYNVLVPVFIVLLAAAWYGWLRRAIGRSGRITFASLPTWVAPSIAIVMVVFAVLRNLPTSWGRALAP